MHTGNPTSTVGSQVDSGSQYASSGEHCAETNKKINKKLKTFQKQNNSTI